MKSTTNPALERDALYSKSRAYISRGFRAQAAKDTDEYQLWASLALELLGKAALAKIHPALVADPLHFQSLFAACGRQISPDIRTITAKTLFERLSHLEKAFDSRHQKFCEQMAIRRNAELHSGESPFSGMSPEAWEREFWGAVEVVLKIQDESLESWLGTEDSKMPAEILEKAEEAMEWALKHRISRCKEEFEKKYQDPKKRAHVVEDSKQFRYWEWPEHRQFMGNGIEKHLCPACDTTGMMAGTLWQEEVSADQDPEDPMTELIELTYVTEEFVCPWCGLHLYGTNETKACGFPEEFMKYDAREREFGEEYGND
ncbi:MAG TPA: hypothetical protein VGI03_04725 [Verrucomicrobiae bacterium]|jgi:hypothetical protein